MDQEEKIITEEEVKEARGKDDLPVLRTLKTDSASYIKKKGVSLLDIATARTQRKSDLTYGRGTEETPSGKSKLLKILIAFVAAIFLIGACAGLYFVFKNQIINPSNNNVSILPKSLIVPDDDIEVMLSEVSGVINKIFPSNKLTYVYVIKEEKDGKKILATTNEFLNNFYIEPPADLAENLGSNFMLYTFSKDGNQPILIFSISAISYDKIFASMIKWENRMLFDFQSMFPRPSILLGAVSNFKDEEIRSRDVRILKDQDGKSLLAYSFFERKYLIIAGDRDSMDEILRRFSSAQYLNN